MPVIQIVLGIALIVFSLLIICVVLLQEGHQGNVKAITGHTADTFYTRHRGRSIDAFLERWTKAISVGFFSLVVATNVVLFFFSK